MKYSGISENLKHHLEQHVSFKFESDSPIWPWLIQYAAQMIHSLKKLKRDDITARQMLRAGATLPDIPNAGEHVYFQLAKTGIIPKDRSKWRT